MVEALRKKIGVRQVPEAAKATLKARRRKVGESLLDLSIDIKRLCGEAYPTLSSASLEQACVDHFTDAIGATLAKDVIRSKPSTLDKALSEALELEALELRAVRMRERVVSEVSTHEKEACQVQNPPLPGWAQSFRLRLRQLPQKQQPKQWLMPSLQAALEETIFLLSLSSLIAGARGHVGQCIISIETACRETSAGGETGRKTESLPARGLSTSDTH